MSEIDRVVLNSVTAMDYEGLGHGAGTVAVEDISAIKQVKIGEVQVRALVDHPEAAAVVIMVGEGGPAFGSH